MRFMKRAIQRPIDVNHRVALFWRGDGGATGCTLSNTTFTGLNTNVSPLSFCTSTQPPSDPVAVGEPGTLALLLTAALGWASVLLMLDRRGAVPGRGLHGMRTPGRWRVCGAGT